MPSAEYVIDRRLTPMPSYVTEEEASRLLVRPSPCQPTSVMGVLILIKTGPREYYERLSKDKLLQDPPRVWCVTRFTLLVCLPPLPTPRSSSSASPTPTTAPCHRFLLPHVSRTLGLHRYSPVVVQAGQCPRLRGRDRGPVLDPLLAPIAEEGGPGPSPALYPMETQRNISPPPLGGCPCHAPYPPPRCIVEGRENHKYCEDAPVTRRLPASSPPW